MAPNNTLSLIGSDNLIHPRSVESESIMDLRKIGDDCLKGLLRTGNAWLGRKKKTRSIFWDNQHLFVIFCLNSKSIMVQTDDMSILWVSYLRIATVKLKYDEGKERKYDPMLPTTLS